MKKNDKYDIIFPIIIGLLAVSLRFANIISIGTEYYANILSDASTYRLWATKLAAGSSYGDPVFQMGPLYPYFLSFLLKIGISFYSILILQSLMGAFVSIAAYFIAKRLFGRSAGFVSGLLTASFAPLIFYDGLFLSESSQTFLLLIALLLLVNKDKKIKYFRIVSSGILIGLVALGRGTILFFPLFLVMFWFYGALKIKRVKDKSYISKSISLLAGVAIGIMPVTINNISHGDMVLISSNNGINFYIGNNSSSTGAYDEPPGLNLATDFTGRKVAEQEKGRALKGSEVSSFWVDKTVKDIITRPASFIKGLLNKLWLYFWYFDIPQAESIQLQYLFSPVFKLPLIGFGLILILGAIGIFSAKWDDNMRVTLLLFLSSIIGVILFFVIGRFRLIGSIVLLVFSGVGVMTIFHAIKNRDRGKIIKNVIVALIAIFVLYLPRSIDKNIKIASAYDNIGIFYYYKNQPDEAIKWYRKAVAVSPLHSSAFNNIGAYYYSKGAMDSSAFYFHKSLEIDSTQDKTYMNLGRIALDSGRKDSALYYYSMAKRFAPFGVDADAAIRQLNDHSKADSPGLSITPNDSFDNLVSIAERFSAQGQFQQAEAFYKKALTIRPDDIKALNNLGFSYQAQKKYNDASQIFNRVVNLYPDNAIAFNNLAGTIYKLGMNDSALVLWAKALKIEPNNTQIKNNYDFVRKLKNNQ